MAAFRDYTTIEDLNRRFEEEAPQLSATGRYARYGLAPYRFRNAGRQMMPSYNHLGSPFMRDSRGRQYTPLAADDDGQCDFFFVRLPKSITLCENRNNGDEPLMLDDRIQLPLPGEELQLTIIDKGNKEETFTRTVSCLGEQKRATAQLTLSEAVTIEQRSANEQDRRKRRAASTDRQSRRRLGVADDDEDNE